MDSQHRHELKTNELAEGLSHLPQLIKDNANFIIGILLIAVALITWPMLSKRAGQKERAGYAAVTESIQMLDQDVYNILQTEDPDAQIDALNTYLLNADTLLSEASDIDNPNLAATAQIKAAQAIRTELQLRPEVTAEMLESQIQKAQEAYEKALETAEIPTLKAMAQIGLALCSEELGQTDQAATLYQQIIDEPSYQETVMPKLAQQRLDTLEDNIEVFKFAPDPVVEEVIETTSEGIAAEPAEVPEAEATPTAEPQTEE